MLRVLATDNLSPAGLKVLENVKDVSVDVKPPLKREDLKKEIGNYHAIIIRSATKLDREIIEHAKQLQLIVRAGIGVDNIDVDAATENGILVANTPRGNSITTAEHTFAMISALARHIPQASSKLKVKEWEKKRFVGVELKAKTLGLIGLGNVGAVVARIAKGYLMNVIAYDPYITAEFSKGLGVQKVELEDLLETSDVISIHAPFNDATRDIVNEKAFGKMKSTAMLVNCARGGIVNEVDLAKAVKSGRIKGAAVDVFEQEPPPEDHPFYDVDNIIMTPHLGASTKEAQEGVSVDACLLLVEYAKYQMVSSAINSNLKLIEGSPKKQAYIKLSQKIGALQGQLLEGGPKKLTVEISGDDLKEIRDYIQLNVAQTFLKSIFSGEKVNAINVKTLAKRRNLSLVCSDVNGAAGQSGFQNIIRVKVEAETSDGKTVEHSVSGVCFGEHNIRVTEIDGYYFDLLPEGYWLLVFNEDKPGVIGKIGTLLGTHNINISQMTVNLRKSSSDALSIFTINPSVDQKVIKEIAEWESIHSCKQVHL